MDAERRPSPGMGIRDEDEAQVGSGLGTQGPMPRTPDGSSHGAAEAGGLGPHGGAASMTPLRQNESQRPR